MKKLEIGTKVTIKDEIVAGRNYGEKPLYFVSDMERLKGKILTISGYTPSGNYAMQETGWKFNDAMLDVVNPMTFEDLKSRVVLKDSIDSDWEMQLRPSSYTKSSFEERIKEGYSLLEITSEDDEGETVDIEFNYEKIKQLQKYINDFVKFVDDTKEKMDKPKEMTLEEIEEKLGYKVRVK